MGGRRPSDDQLSIVVTSAGHCCRYQKIMRVIDGKILNASGSVAGDIPRRVQWNEVECEQDLNMRESAVIFVSGRHWWEHVLGIGYDEVVVQRLPCQLCRYCLPRSLICQALAAMGSACAVRDECCDR
jgi:hypothetical protein